MAKTMQTKRSSAGTSAHPKPYINKKLETVTEKKAKAVELVASLSDAIWNLCSGIPIDGTVYDVMFQVKHTAGDFEQLFKIWENLQIFVSRLGDLCMKEVALTEDTVPFFLERKFCLSPEPDVECLKPCTWKNLLKFFRKKMNALEIILANSSGPETDETCCRCNDEEIDGDDCECTLCSDCQTFQLVHILFIGNPFNVCCHGDMSDEEFHRLKKECKKYTPIEL